MITGSGGEFHLSLDPKLLTSECTAVASRVSGVLFHRMDRFGAQCV